MRRTIRPVRRLLAGAALLTVAAVVPLSSTNDPVTARVAATVASDACGPIRFKANGTVWTCTFVDRFDGTTLDTSKWSVQKTSIAGFRTGRTCYTSSPRNVAVRDGGLHLVAVKGPRFICRNPLDNFGTRYTGGMVGTRGKFSQTYGRFEVRAMYPTAQVSGIHGGFWMYPREHTYGTWPTSGEIDVAEWWSSDPTLVLPSLHYKGRDPGTDSGWSCRVADVSTFHAYAVEWYRTTMRFFIDGAMCWERSWQPDAPLVAPQPFDRPFSMILNMGVGTATGVNKITARTPFPATYVVDYAKAWR